MSTVVIPQYLRVAQQTNKFLRNGNFYPDASVHRYIVDETNRISALRVKTLASWSCPIDAIPAAGSGSGSRTRWRAYVHTSPFAKYVYARFLLAKATPDVASDPYAKLLVEQTNGTDVGTAVRHYGYTSTSASDTPGNFDLSRRKLSANVSGDTDYLLTVSDEDGARLVACDVYEVSAEPDTANGYLDSSGIVGDGPILDSHMASATSALRTHWKRGASSLFTWASNTDATAPTNSTTTDKNIIDNATTVSGATPGWTVDLANRSTVRRTTVPCVFAVFSKKTLNDCTVKLKDSGGSAVATITVNNTTATWFTTTVNLPASSAKYDIHFVGAAGGSVCTMYAASLFQYEA